MDLRGLLRSVLGEGGDRGAPAARTFGWVVVPGTITLELPAERLGLYYRIDGFVETNLARPAMDVSVARSHDGKPVEIVPRALPMTLATTDGTPLEAPTPGAPVSTRNTRCYSEIDLGFVTPVTPGAYTITVGRPAPRHRGSGPVELLSYEDAEPILVVRTPDPGDWMQNIAEVVASWWHGRRTRS